jgi:hypothetical protein
MSTDRVFWQWAKEGLAEAEAEVLAEDDELDCYLLLQRLAEREFVPADLLEREVIAYLEDMTINNDYFITASGLRGLVPKSGVRPADHIIVIHGAAAPFCARQDETSSSGPPVFSLLAPCFVENDVLDTRRLNTRIMFGAAVRAREAAFELDQLHGEEVFNELYLI